MANSNIRLLVDQDLANRTDAPWRSFSETLVLDPQQIEYTACPSPPPVRALALFHSTEASEPARSVVQVMASSVVGIALKFGCLSFEQMFRPLGNVAYMAAFIGDADEDSDWLLWSVGGPSEPFIGKLKAEPSQSRTPFVQPVSDAHPPEWLLA